MNKVIPKHYKHLFNTWEEYRDWKTELARKQLEEVFQNDREDWKEKNKTD